MKVIEKLVETYPPEISTESLSREIHTSFEYLAPMREAWDQFAAEAGGGIYFSYDWCRIWWEHYGLKRTIQIFLFRVDKQLVGIVPVFIERIRLGPVKLRIAKLVGSQYSMTLCNPPVHPKYAGTIFENVIEHLIGSHHCDALWFGPLPQTTPAAELRRVCQKTSTHTRIMRDTLFAPQIGFTLPGTFQKYLESLEKRQQTNFRRDWNLLNRDFRVKTDVIEDPVLAEVEFPSFKAMHDLQWQAEGKLGHFDDWPGAEEFNRDLLKTMARDGRLRLVRLLANDEVVSYQLCYRFGDALYWRLPARVTGSEWNRYGLGRIGLIKMIETAIAEGVRYIEAGMGHYDYKIRLGGVERPLQSILIASDRRASRAKTYLFGHLADVLHLLYYRIWFNRLAPRLPLPRRPLRKTWIQSRL
jgi:CelD/BcsL family acetyltransferase involved in cellulose biosynthesis